jgi:transmembrane sensor
MTNTDFDSEKINRYFKGEYSERDKSYIDEVFCDNSKEKDLEHLLFRQFHEILNEDTVDKKNLDHILHKIHFDINTRLSEQKKWSFDNIVRWTLRIAAIVIIPFLIFSGVQTYREVFLKKESWVEIKTPGWTRAQFSLPDGTTGWLNNNSSIRYNEKFINDRKVTLTGEAFFDVYKDKKRPFIVNTNAVSVKVLGTRFNISSYENEKNVEVVLEEGELALNDNLMNEVCTISPNDLVIYDKTLRGFSTETVEPKKYLSWTEGKLVFRNDKLDVIARKLERWYNVDIDIEGCLAGDFRLRATFVDEDIESVLDLLKHSLPIDYKIENRGLRPDEIYARKKVIITLRNK